MCCQYGEERIILPFAKNGGYVVDIGAADGETYSNSRFLIRDHGWRGVLIEPEPTQYAKLAALYAGHRGVKTVRAAVGAVDKLVTLWPGELASTLLPEWVEHTRRVAPHVRYGSPIEIRQRPLADILAEVGAPPVVDFLSIDCEGMDLEAFESRDTYQARLVCVESRPGDRAQSDLAKWMNRRGYRFCDRTHGNAFFVYAP